MRPPKVKYIPIRPTRYHMVTIYAYSCICCTHINLVFHLFYAAFQIKFLRKCRFSYCAYTQKEVWEYLILVLFCGANFLSDAATCGACGKSDLLKHN